MFSSSPPQKQARYQRAASTALALSARRNVGRSAARTTNTNVVAGVTTNISYLVDSGVAYIWRNSGVNTESTRIAVAGMRTDFLAEGFEVPSLVSCSTSGLVSFTEGSGYPNYQLFDSDEVRVTAFGSIPAARRVVAATSTGDVITAAFGEEGITVSSVQVGSPSTPAPEPEANTSGSWLSGWFGSAKKPSQQSVSIAQAAGEAVTSLAVSVANPNIVYCAAGDSLFAVDVATSEVVWQTALADSTTGVGYTRSIVESGDAVHALVVASGVENVEGAACFVATYAKETGDRRNRTAVRVAGLKSPLSSGALDFSAAMSPGDTSAAADNSSANFVSLLASPGRKQVAIATTKALMWIPVAAGVRESGTYETQSLDVPIFAAGVGSHSFMLMTLDGPVPVAAPHGENTAVSASDIKAGDATGRILAAIREGRSADDEVLSICRDIVDDVQINPANWARGDLDADDINILTYVTNSLLGRQERHRFQSEAVFNNASIAAAVCPETLAELQNAQEQLVALNAIRKLQNETTGSVQVDRSVAASLKAAISELANDLRKQDGEGRYANASSSEIAFMVPSNIGGLLEVLVESVYAAGNDPDMSIGDKLRTTVAVATSFAAVCSSIGFSRDTLAVPEDATAFLWTTQMPGATYGFEQTLKSLLEGVSNMLVHSIDMRLTMPVPDSVEESLALDDLQRALLGKTEPIMRFLFTHCAGCADRELINEVIVGMFLRSPFYTEDSLGYPHGNPRAADTSAVNDAVADLTLNLANDFAVYGVLCELSLGNFVVAGEVEEAASNGTYDFYRRLVDQHMAPANSLGLLEYSISWLLSQKREDEVMQIGTILPSVGDAVLRRDEHLARNAPHFRWMIDGHAYRSLMKASKMAVPGSQGDEYAQVARQGALPEPFPLGETPLSHRLASLSLAKLSWVAAGRPSSMKHVLDLELATANAQREFLQGSENLLLSTTQVMRGLLDMYKARPTEELCAKALFAAAKLADMVTDDSIRMPFLQDCVAQAFIVGGAAVQLDAIHRDAASDAESLASVKSLAVAKVIEASAKLRLELFSREGGVVREAVGSQKHFAMLLGWGKKSFL